MPIKHFALLNDAIDKIIEAESITEVQRMIYAEASEDGREKIAPTLFPTKNNNRAYLEYDDNGEGVRMLKRIAGR